MNAFCPPRHFRRDADIEPAPGTIVAELSNGHDALALCRMKGPGYTVTAGDRMAFAVRKVCEHPITHLRANDAGQPECGACGVVIIESAGVTMVAHTERGKEALPELARRLGVLS